MKTTVAAVNAQLRKMYGVDAKGEAKVKMYAGRGYYYFSGETDSPTQLAFSYHLNDLVDAGEAAILQEEMDAHRCKGQREGGRKAVQS